MLPYPFILSIQVYPNIAILCHVLLSKRHSKKITRSDLSTDLDRKYEGVILLLRGSVSLQINGVEVVFDKIRFDSTGCGKLGRPESVCKIDTGRNALADVLE